MIESTGPLKSAAVGAAIAVVCLIGGSRLLGSGHDRGSETPMSSGVVDWLSNTPSLPPETRRSVLIERINDHPDEVETIVERLSTATPTTQPSPTDVAEDLVVLDALQHAMTRVTSVAGADDIARAREVIAGRAQQKLTNLVASLTEEGKVCENDPQAALATSAWATDVDRVLSLQSEGTFTVDGVNDLVSGIVQGVHSAAQNQLDHANALLHQREEAIQQPQNQVDPTAMHNGNAVAGACAAELAAIARIQGTLADDRLHRWARVIRPDEEQALVKLQSQLAECSEGLSRTQLALYNLWAIRQIYSAESSSEWATFLGSVDRSLMHPAVSAIWNLTQEHCFAAIQNTNDRPDRVRTLLTAVPVGLERF